MSTINLGRIGICPRGAYSAAAAYGRLDMVTMGGDSYLALRDVQGVTPADDGVNWRRTIFVSEAVSAAEEAAQAAAGAVGYVAALYDQSKTYVKDEHCIHDGALFRALCDIPVPEAWTDAHWAGVSAGDELTGQRRAAEAAFSVPAEYARLAYLEADAAADGGGWISTGLPADQDTRVVCEFSIPKPLEAGNNLFGARESTSLNAFSAGVSVNGCYRFGLDRSTAAVPFASDTARHTLDLSRNGALLDGNPISGGSARSFQTPSNVYLFAIRGSNSSRIYYGSMRIYDFKMYQDGALVRHYLPILRLSDGRIGMYEAVEGAYKGYSGTLHAGPALGLAQTAPETAADYIEPEADALCARARAFQKRNTLTFLTLTDLHVKDGDAAISAALNDMAKGARAVCGQLHVDFAAFLGDLIWRLSSDGDFETGKREMLAGVKLLGCAMGGAPQFRLVGNHDPNCEGATGCFNERELLTYLGAYNDLLTPNPDGHDGGYGWRDFYDVKLRLIALNTSDQGWQTYTPTQGSTYYHFTLTQLRWLAEKLDLSEKDDADEWQIVLFSHAPLTAKDAEYRQGREILAAYEAGGAVTIGGRTFDFSGKNAAKLALYVYGHAHNLGFDSVTDEDGARTLHIPQIAMPNALPGRESEGYPTKTANSAKSTAFTVNVLDPAEKTLHSLCWGAGYDRHLHYASVTVSDHAVLTPDVIEPVRWASVHEETATVEDGIVTAVAAGNTPVYAEAENGEREIWNISVV